MSVYPPNSYRVKFEKQRHKVNPLNKFLTTADIEWNPQAKRRTLDRIRLWSGGNRPIEYAGALVGGYESVNGKVKAMIVDVVTLPAWNIANRENAIQILVDDFERVKKIKKNVVGLVHSHPNNDLLCSLNDWSLFSYLDALYPKDGLIFIIMDPDGNTSIYNFPQDEPYANSFRELFRRVMEAMKSNRRGQTADERSDRGSE